ncbi:uncharacterized protein METZ01_LOCUS46145 [marine metagenome]|uniref:Uncharacterized protein n=1 Tax=marine metagenome TaxID=408172 RepID=A0A381RQ60_9ZZZZ
MIEELVIVEFVRGVLVWLDYHTPAVPIGVIVEQIGIVLDLPIQFHNFAGERRVDQKRFDLAVVAGGDGNQQILHSDLVTTPHDSGGIIIVVLGIGVTLELAIVLRAGEYYSDNVAVLSTDELADPYLH